MSTLRRPCSDPDNTALLIDRRWLASESAVSAKAALVLALAASIALCTSSFVKLFCETGPIDSVGIAAEVSLDTAAGCGRRTG